MQSENCVDVGRSKRAALAGNIAVVLLLIALAVATIRFVIEQSKARACNGGN